MGALPLGRYLSWPRLRSTLKVRSEIGRLDLAWDFSQNDSEPRRFG